MVVLVAWIFRTSLKLYLMLPRSMSDPHVRWSLFEVHLVPMLVFLSCLFLEDDGSGSQLSISAVVILLVKFWRLLCTGCAPGNVTPGVCAMKKSAALSSPCALMFIWFPDGE